ncbi:hypothetical protein B0H13DRAFT_1998362 [Mycena leptocephala]|nr:hypothetical protein B0H13DRAFT_1998362 [Mycena leptocephala]
MAVNVYNAYLLAASWLNCALFMLEIYLMIRYFQLPSRPLLHRIGVAAILVFDTICTFAISADVYLMLLLFPCDSDHLFIRPSLVTLAVIIFATYATASIVQLFLCNLYFNLTKRRTISVFLVLCIAVHLGFSYASAILVLVNNTPLGSSFLTTKIGIISCAVTDILIASALLYTFVRIDKTMVVQSSTQSLLRRLMVLILTAGVAVATTTLLVMILLLKQDPAYLLFFYTQGRVYAVTILCNFLVGMSQSMSPAANAHVSIITSVAFHSDYDGQNSGGNYSRRRHSVDMDPDQFASPVPKLRVDND